MWHRCSPVQKDQLSFGAPLVKKGSCRAFGHGRSCATRRGSDDVELDHRRTGQIRQRLLASGRSYHIVDWRAFRLFVNVAYSLLHGVIRDQYIRRGSPVLERRTIKSSFWLALGTSKKQALLVVVAFDSVEGGRELDSEPRA